LSLRSKPLESTGRGWQGQGSRRSGLGAQVGLALTDGGGKRQYLEVLSWPAKARNSHSKLNSRLSVLVSQVLANLISKGNLFASELRDLLNTQVVRWATFF